MKKKHLNARLIRLQFPHELVTYGGNGQVFSNWAQFWLVMYYLAKMGEDQTLSMYSGHPMGLFPSHANAPRVVITNGKGTHSETSLTEFRQQTRSGNLIAYLPLKCSSSCSSSFWFLMSFCSN